nr:zf-TFIIB domain-containing protein [Ketogulonicigenium vulgare]
MKCPVDNETLVMTSRNGVEIDYCPTCRGVWLDRGELDKIVERSEQVVAAAPAPAAAPQPDRHRDDDRGGRYRDDRGRGDRYDDDDDDRRDGRRGRRRESFLGDLFDF